VIGAPLPPLIASYTHKHSHAHRYLLINLFTLRFLAPSVGKFFDYDGFFDQDAFDDWMAKVLKDFENKGGKSSGEDPHLNFGAKLIHFFS
jgi:hypothetical protein